MPKIIERSPSDSSMGLEAKEEARANRIIATLLMFFAELYLLMGFLFGPVLFYNSFSGSQLYLLACGIFFLCISLPAVLRWIPARGYKYLLMISMELSLFGFNFLTGYKTWMLFAIPLVFACRYSSQRLVRVCGVIAMMLTILCGLLNVFVSPTLGLMDMNTVSYPDPAGITAHIQGFLYPVVQEYPVNIRTTLWNTLRLSVLPNLLTLFLLMQACHALVLFHRQQLQETRRRLEEEAALKVQLAESRNRITVSQIQPHFLYNTLTAIMAIDGNPDETVEAIGEFGKYLRENLSTLTAEDMIPFAKEFEHVRHYLNLEKLRFRERLQIVYDLRAADFLLPALTVQMLAENAVKHGLTPKASGGTLTIRSEETEDAFVITVSDNGVGCDPGAVPDDGKHIGIANVRSRLQALCGGSLTIESMPGAGTDAVVRIPKKRRISA